MHEESFRAHLDALGYRTSARFAFDGRLRRVGWVGEGRRASQKTGWYVGYDHGDWAAVGWGDWRDNHRDTWTSKSDRRLSSAEREELRRRIEDARAKAAEERFTAQLSAATRAMIIWSACHLADPSSPPPYCDAKQIPTDGMRVHPRRRGDAVIPIYDESQCLVNLQTIKPTGQKLFLAEAAVAGSHWRTGPMPPVDFAGDLIVAEGVATAATVRRLAGGTTTFAAFNAGNLEAVSTWLRSHFRNARILVAADDDRWERDGTPRPNEKNAGRLKALAAAEKARAIAIFPKFASHSSRGTDWNDLFCEEGEAAAAVKWRAGMQIGALDRQLAVIDERDYMMRRASLLSAYRAAGAAGMGTRQIDRRRREIRKESSEASDDDDSPLAVLDSIASRAEFWHDQFGVPFATFEFDGKWVNSRAEGQFFRDWLRREFKDSTGTIIPMQTLDAVVSDFSGAARIGEVMHESHVRCGFDGEAHWLDLGRSDWSAVRITADGWHVEPRAAVKFLRAPGDCALPIPRRTKEGIDPLWRLVNVAPEDQCLVAGWLLGAMISTSSAFGLNIFGPQGSAKTSATRVLRRIIDPAGALTQKVNQNKIDDFPLTCIHQWIPALENVSYLSEEMQDTLCRLSTGETDQKRKLYSDDGIFITAVRRPWIINGINNVCCRGDLAERSVPVQLRMVEKRKTEKAVEEEFQAAWPGLVAAILDACSMAMSQLDATAAYCESQGLTHRMADAAIWITAGEESLGFAAGSFLRRLCELQSDEGAAMLDGHPIVAAIELLLNEVSSQKWEGTNEELLKAIREKAPNRNDKGMPEDVRALGRWIGREQARLKDSMGIMIAECQRSRDEHGRRIYKRTIHRI